MKTRNFSHTLAATFEPIAGIPISILALQLVNPAGNNPVVFRWGVGVEQSLAGGRTHDFVAIDKDDPLRNEIEVRGTASEILIGEFWVENDQA